MSLPFFPPPLPTAQGGFAGEKQLRLDEDGDERFGEGNEEVAVATMYRRLRMLRRQAGKRSAEVIVRRRRFFVGGGRRR